MSDIQKLIDHVAIDLDGKPTPTEDGVYKLVQAHAGIQKIHEPECSYGEQEIGEVVRKLMSRYDVRMSFGDLFASDKHIPWLHLRQGGIDWYYWERYRKHLQITKEFPIPVVRTLDAQTDKILDHMKNPLDEGVWGKRGLVVGHVQSGKTANYAGLICKAADAGYRVIIVLAGTLNSLRNQTQSRIDSDFMGWCTKLDEWTGASDWGKERRPVCFTTSIKDFSRNSATTIAASLQAFREPVVFVLKKNKSTLENIYNWLLEQNSHQLREFPMLLIDDEADHASVNTRSEEDNPTTINRLIRDLLSIFEKTSYVGYTATPFANIFIDPENENEMSNGELYKDLFPRDFILSLNPPTNYVGAARLFTQTADLDCIREIFDNEDCLPTKHKIYFIPEILPDSFIRALNCFVLVRAIRLLRGHNGRHHSMMVNASRFKSVQNYLKLLILDTLKDIRSAINNYSSLPTEQAIQNSVLASIFETWEAEYSTSGHSWEDVLGMLREAVAPIEVLAINSSSTDKLDYSEDLYPAGRSVIAVGGFGLSRGLTLEGLEVSYFLRSSIMYDTLMQMGRWFGYRDGYAELCRIFMTPDAMAWYAHISDATEELREDFSAMARANLRPIDFGLRVRSHPSALIVTARNKMRTGKKVPHRISLEGRLVETLVLSSDPEVTEKNLNLFEAIVSQADELTDRKIHSKGYVWESLPVDILKSFVRQFINHPQSIYTHYFEPLVAHLDWLNDEGIIGFDILVKTLVHRKDDPSLGIGDLRGRAQERQDTAHFEGSFISFKKKSRIGESADETAGLSPEVLENLIDEHGASTLNPKIYRNVAGKRPLLILHLLKLDGDLKMPAYGLAFPGETTSRRPKKLVEYVVNIPWWNSNYGTGFDEE